MEEWNLPSLVNVRIILENYCKFSKFPDFILRRGRKMRVKCSLSFDTICSVCLRDKTYAKSEECENNYYCTFCKMNTHDVTEQQVKIESYLVRCNESCKLGQSIIDHKTPDLNFLANSCFLPECRQNIFQISTSLKTAEIMNGVHYHFAFCIFIGYHVFSVKGYPQQVDDVHNNFSCVEESISLEEFNYYQTHNNNNTNNCNYNNPSGEWHNDCNNSSCNSYSYSSGYEDDDLSYSSSSSNSCSPSPDFYSDESEVMNKNSMDLDDTIDFDDEDDICNLIQLISEDIPMEGFSFIQSEPLYQICNSIKIPFILNFLKPNTTEYINYPGLISGALVVVSKTLPKFLQKQQQQ